MGDAAKRLVEKVRRLVPEFQARLSDPVPAYPEHELRVLAKCGALAAPLPRTLGGYGLGLEPHSHAGLLQLLREAGRANLALGRIFEGHVNALLLIARCGTEEQLAAAARDVLERRLVFGVWNTGPAGEPAVTRLYGGRYRFTGGKTFASGAGWIDRAIITGELEEAGWQMFIVPVGDLEGRVDSDSWHPMGMEASDSFRVDLSGMEVEAGAALGQPEDYYVEPFFTGGAFRFATVQLGGAQALFEFISCHVRERGQTDNPHQLHRLGRIAVAAESGRQWIAQAGHWLDNQMSCPECLITQARMMRVAAAAICADVAHLAEESAGARGLEGRRPVARMLRDLRMYLRQAGADAAITAVGEAACRRQERP